MIVKPSAAKHTPVISFDLSEGVSIVGSVVWSVYPVEAGGMTVTDGSSHVDAGDVRCAVTGGLDGHLYVLSAKATLSSGEDDVRSLTYRIGDLEATP